MKRTRLETFRQSRVLVVVVVVGAYSPITGNRARQLRGSTPCDDVGPMNPVAAHSGPPLLAGAGSGADESPAILGDASPPLGGDALPAKGRCGSRQRCSGCEQASPGKIAGFVDQFLHLWVDRHATGVLVVSGNVGEV